MQQRKASPYKISYNGIISYSLQAKKLLGKPSNNLLLLLENRLDTTLCRIRFAQSILQARQLIHHKKIHINGKPTQLPGYQLKPGDIIQLKQTSELQSSRFSQKKLPFKLEKKFKKNTRKIKKNQKRKISKKRPSFLFRPLHFEINFVTGTAIYLYPPQKIYYSQRVYPDLIRRSFKRTL